MAATVYQSTLRSLPLLGRGKVRDNYAVGNDKLLIVTTDRLSAFDVIMAEPIPDKGRVLNRMALFWFDRLADVVPNHLTGIDPETVVAADEREQVRDRAMVVKRLQPILVEGNADKHDAFAAVAQSGGAGLIKSGTSSLEMAVAGIPHVVAYRVNPITAAIVRRLVKVPHASLVNLMAEREVVPERIQEACLPDALAEALLRPMLDPAVAAAQRAGFLEALAKLRAPEGLPSDAAAEAVLKVLEASTSG